MKRNILGSLMIAVAEVQQHLPKYVNSSMSSTAVRVVLVDFVDGIPAEFPEAQEAQKEEVSQRSPFVRALWLP